MAANDVTGILGAPSAAAGSALTSFVTASAEQHWAYIGANQHVYNLWWAPSTGYTGANDVTGILGVESAVPGSALTSFITSSGEQHWAFTGAGGVNGASLYLYNLWWAPSTGYTGADDVTGILGAPSEQ